MASYSYTAKQLKKKVAPKEKFRVSKTIVIVASSFVVVGIGALIANAPTPSSENKVLQQPPQKVNPYRCAVEENWFIETTNETECSQRQREHITKKNAEFERDLRNYVRLIELDNGTRNR